jgi:nicotinamidase-related amidase
MAQSALLVIDVQKSFLHRPYWSERDVPAFRAALTALMAGCVARRTRIVRVFHVEDHGPFSVESALVAPLEWVPVTYDVEIRKRAHNAFTGTELEAWLRRAGVDHVVVAGIRTEQCCETTARMASDLGFRVDFVTAATLTFPMVHAGTGRAYSAAEIKERTELVLANRFARICTVDECLDQARVA